MLRRFAGSVLLLGACTQTGASGDADSGSDGPATTATASPTSAADASSGTSVTAGDADTTAVGADSTGDGEDGTPVGEGGCAGEGEPLTAIEQMIAELDGDTWITLPGTDMRQACSTDADAYHCHAVIAAWSGGAWDPVHRQLLVFGGGHADSSDNALYAFDLGTATWSTLTERSDPSLMNADPLPDGQPASRHSYDGLQYLTSTQRLFAWGGSRWMDGYGTNVTWMYDHDGGWTDMQVEPEGAGSYSSATAYDPASDGIITVTGESLQRYDVATNTWSRLADYGYPPYWPRYAGTGDKRGTVDTSRGLFFGFGGGLYVVYDIAADAHVTDDWITTGGAAFDNADHVPGHDEQRIVTGGGEVITANSPGVDYDRAADALVAWVGGGAWRLDLVTKTWTQGSSTGAPAPTQNSGGTFGRWRYVPRVNAFLLVDDVATDVYVYKHTADCGP